MQKAAWVLVGVLLAGCGMGQHVGINESAFERWRKAWVLRDEGLEVVVVLAGGRIVSVAKVGGRGGENLLWVGQGPAKAGEWNNLGGDKVWVWPQEKWGKVEGLRQWPPEEGFDQEAFEVVKIRRGVRMVGPWMELDGARVRVEREVELLGGGRMRTVNRWVGEGASETKGEWAAWTIAQMPVPAEVVVEGARVGEVQKLGFGDWEGMAQRGADVVLPGRGGGMAKVGADGEALVWRRGLAEVRFRVVVGEKYRVQSTEYRVGDAELGLGEGAGRRVPGEKLQVFRLASEEPGKAYVELELTGELGRIGAGRGAEVVVEWEVR